jgi:hypothetical protein
MVNKKRPNIRYLSLFAAECHRRKPVGGGILAKFSSTCKNRIDKAACLEDAVAVDGREWSEPAL